MKRIIAIVLLCWSAGVMAEEKVWYCTEVASAGLAFEDGKYGTTSFPKYRITIKQDGSKFTFSDTPPYALFQGEVECKYYEYLAGVHWFAPAGGHWFACTSITGLEVFTLRPDTGLASMALVGGWI